MENSESEYTITFARSARKELEGLELEVIERIFPRIVALSKEPRPKGCRKLKGNRNLWRIRIGDYRVVYSIDDKNKVVDVVVVRSRGKAYR